MKHKHHRWLHPVERRDIAWNMVQMPRGHRKAVADKLAKKHRIHPRHCYSVTKKIYGEGY